MSNLNEVIQLAAKEIEESKNLDELEKTRIKFFGKSGLINQEMKNISKLDVDQKKEVGKKLNLFKSDFNIKFNHKKDFFEKKKKKRKILK